MKFKYPYINTLFKAVSPSVLIGLLVMSCQSDDLYIDSHDKDDSDLIQIKAGIIAPQHTRTYYGEDEIVQINEGTFYLHYPTNETGVSVEYAKNLQATVTFGNPEDPTTGYVSYLKDGVLKDLKWNSIYGEGQNSNNPPYFYMHNAVPSSYTYTPPSQRYYQKLLFNDNSPYVASPLDKVNGTNDLLSSGSSATGNSGYVSASNSTKNILFNLFHRMSMLKINFEVFGTADHIVSLENAEVKITNLYPKLVSLNLNYPLSYLDYSNSSYGQYGTKREDIVLRGHKDDNTFYDWGEKTSSTYTDEQGTEYDKMTYSVQDFVIPPQPYTSGYAPRLIIRIPKKDFTGAEQDEGYYEFSGMIPDRMFPADKDGTISTPSPIQTDFTSGYQLHITASIGSPNTELTFSPVRIEYWVSKGSFTIKTKKAGIYTKEDFYKVIELYKEKNLHELEKYGYVSSGTLILQFWGSMTLNEEDNTIEGNDGEVTVEPGIKGCMPYFPDIPFRFVLNDYTVTVIESDGEKEELSGLTGQNKLYQIVTGNDQAEVYTGIQNGEDLAEFLSLSHKTEENPIPNTGELMKFGYLNNFDNSWEFNITGDCEIAIEDIFQTIDKDYLGVNFTINFNDNSIIIKAGDENVLTYQPDQEYNVFEKIAYVTSTYGIYSSDDFYLLLDCYNKFYPYCNDILKLFGTLNSSSGSWTLQFRNAMTLEGEKAFVSMVPDSENGLPNYSISGSSTITFEDEKVPVSTNNNTNIYKILSGSGASTANNTLNNSIKSAYQTSNYLTLWQYGRFVNNQWIFPLVISGQNIIYVNLDGQMKPDSDTGKYDYSFELFDISYEVKSVPKIPPGQTGTTLILSGEEGAEILKIIAEGKYLEWLESLESPDENSSEGN